MQQARIYVQSSFYSFIVCLGKSMLRPIIILFFYRLFRKVYAMSNGMYLFLPIDRFLRMRSRNLLMYLDPLVSLRFSSFELVILLHIHHILFRSCRTNLVSRSHVTLLTKNIHIIKFHGFIITIPSHLNPLSLMYDRSSCQQYPYSKFLC